MNPRLLATLQILAFVLLAWSVVARRAETSADRALSVADESQVVRGGGALHAAEPQAPMLSVAVVQIGVNSLDEAVLDATAVALEVDAPAHVRLSGAKFVVGRAAAESQLELELAVQYRGESGGASCVQIRDVEATHQLNLARSRSGGNSSPCRALGGLWLRRGEPVLLPNLEDGYVLIVQLHASPSEVPREVSVASLLRACAVLPDAPPLSSRDPLLPAIDELRNERFLFADPGVSAAHAAWLFRDARLLARVRARAQADASSCQVRWVDGARRREFVDERSLLEWDCVSWLLGRTSDCGLSELGRYSPFANAWAARAASVVPSAPGDTALADAVRGAIAAGRPWEVLLQLEPQAALDSVRSTLLELRGIGFDQLRWPLSALMKRNWTAQSWLYAPLVLAALFVVVARRGANAREPLGVGVAWMWTAAITCFVDVGALDLEPVFAVLMSVAVWRSGRAGGLSSWRVAACATLALAGLWSGLLWTLHLGFREELLASVTALAPLFAWLSIGAVVARERRWIGVGALELFLVVSVLAALTVPLGRNEMGTPLGWSVVLVGGGALLLFLVRGKRPVEPRAAATSVPAT